MLERHFLEKGGIENNEGTEDLSIRLDVSLEELEKGVEGDVDLENLLDEVLDNCLRYTETVLKMRMILNNKDSDEFAQEIADSSGQRTRIHNATIESIDILARTMKSRGRDNSWIQKLRPIPFSDNRSVYGRFAIAVTLYRASKS